MQVNFNLQTYQRERWQAAALLWFSGLGSLFMASLAFALISTACPRLARGAIALLGVGSAGVAIHQRSKLRELEAIEGDLAQAERVGRQQQLMEFFATPDAFPMFAPAVDAELVSELQCYDLRDIANENHTAIIGPTGSGKSFLCQALISQYFQGSEVIAYDTDAAPHEWEGVPVLGRKGNLGEIVRAMDADLRLLDQRTELRGDGRDVGNEVVRIIEEFPTVSADLAPAKKGDPNIATDWLLRLLRRGRKYRIKVFGVSTEFEVKAWGLDGQGSARKALTIIFLGGEAFSRLDDVRDRAYRAQLREWLEKQRRPALVLSKGRFYPCPIPELGGGLPAIEGAQQDAIALPSGGDAITQLERAYQASKDLADIDDNALSAEMRKLIEISRNIGWISASQAKQQSRLFKGNSPDEIRAYFEILKALGLGETRGQDNQLIWAIDPEEADESNDCSGGDRRSNDDI